MNLFSFLEVKVSICLSRRVFVMLVLRGGHKTPLRFYMYYSVVYIFWYFEDITSIPGFFKLYMRVIDEAYFLILYDL